MWVAWLTRPVFQVWVLNSREEQLPILCVMQDGIFFWGGGGRTIKMGSKDTPALVCVEVWLEKGSFQCLGDLNCSPVYGHDQTKIFASEDKVVILFWFYLSFPCSHSVALPQYILVLQRRNVMKKHIFPLIFPHGLCAECLLFCCCFFPKASEQLELLNEICTGFIFMSIS